MDKIFFKVQYRADKSGFRVTANNQPVQDTAEVAEARQKHLKIWEAIANHNRALQQRQQQQQSLFIVEDLIYMDE